MHFRLLLILSLITNSAFTQINHSISNVGTTWSPSSLTIEIGDTVTWTNTGGNHNVNGTQSTFAANPESFGNSVGAGWTLEHVFTIAGTYNYQCDPHASMGMTGTITVEASNTGVSTLNPINHEIYPNPFYNVINIKSCNSCYINIYSVIGKLELKKHISSDNYKLTTDCLPEGVYLYEIFDMNKKIKSGKLIKY